MARARSSKIRFTAALQDLPDNFLQCRDIRHQWKVNGDYTPDKNVISRSIICTRCQAERMDTYSAKTFDKISTQYRYPANYQIKGNGIRGGGGSMVRREAFTRSQARPRMKRAS